MPKYCHVLFSRPNNARPINSVNRPIRRLTSIQWPTEPLPVNEFPNNGSIFESRLRDEKQSLVSGVDKLKMELQSLVSGVEKISMEHEDSIVYPSLPVVLGWIAGARSLVSGVVCNAPGVFPN